MLRAVSKIQYMERAETLTKLRGDHGAFTKHSETSHEQNNNHGEKRVRFEDRFPPAFAKSTPENVKKIILWCLERDPAKRPSAEELLSVSYRRIVARVRASAALDLHDCLSLTHRVT